MKTRNSWIFVLTALFCGALYCANAEAKVCFASDPGCSGGADFGDNYNDDSIDQCKNAGYILKTDCESNPNMHATSLCPYNPAYVTCCGKEFDYDLCSYPLLNNGKCGGKLKCICDKGQFPFNDAYNDSSCKIKYPGSLQGGGTCVQTAYSATASRPQTDIYYSECICNPASYPFEREDCADGTEPSDEGCTGTDGTPRYSACICNRTKYQFASNDCEFGGNMDRKDGYCIQGGSYFFKQCYSCDAFPADSLDNVAPGGEGVSYTRCTYGNRYKITKCIKGYRPGEGGSNCRKVNCLEAIDEWLTDNPSYKSRYNLLASSSDISKFGLLSASSNQTDIGSSSNQKDIIIASEKISLSNIYAGVNYYGGGYFGKMKGGYLADSCKTITYDGINKQAKPNVTYTYSTGEFYIPSQWGWSSSNRGKVKLYGIKLSASNIRTAYGFDCVNCDINVSNWTIPATVDYAPSLTFNSSYYTEGYESKPNISVSSSMNVYSYFSSNGYSYDVWSMNLEVPTGYKNSEFAKFTFSEGQEFNARYVYLYPSSNDRQTYWGTSISFVGPYGDLPVNIYSNINIGDNKSGKGAKGMFAKISGNINWNLYSGAANYTIGLSPQSKLYSTDFGSGNYARIKRGSDSKWQACEMSSWQHFSDRWKNAKLCTGKCYNTEEENYAYYAFCYVGKDGSATMTGDVSYVSAGNTRCSCSQQYTSINWGGCSFSAGGWTKSPMSCW